MNPTRPVKTVKQLLADSSFTVDDLAQRASLERRIAQHVVDGQWTPSPQQRERIAQALGVRVDEIRWGHSTPVDHMYGHGPQFGRSP